MSTDKKTFATVNPATEEEIATYTYMTSETAFKAVEECHSAYLEWRTRPVEDRAKIIKSIGKELINQKDKLAKLMTEEMGKLLRQGHQEIELCAGICEFTGTEGIKYLKDEERDLAEGGKGIITYSPIGVIYGIQPWNFPTYQVIRYSIANLLAGNGILLKHAKNVTGSALLLQEIYNTAGLPNDLFKVLIVDHDLSDKIIEHDLVRGVTLTGSSEAGRIIGKKAGAVLKKTVLELGSNDAYLVLDDADVALAAKTCVQGRIYNNGETCVSAKRFIVTEKVYDQFRDAFIEGMKAIVTGDPTEKSSKMGPLARKDLRKTLHEQVEESVKKGAKISLGGVIPEGKGYYYPATVLENVTPGQPAYDDELFGPVASLIKAKDNEDAMRIANDSQFGLGGGIFSNNEDKAIQLAREHFDTGMVNINSFGLARPNMPFGGIKNSGFGREHGGFGIREFVNAKSIYIPRKD
ncbi:succinate-semialdehyde dehydrogenase/glutarate-semialdehyde dehydrogenase [Gelidibacter sediminis]|uniref:Succinate-semialdehyde dehydrogenase/glutarate-semialdehyde dehydrogenase n=1 Tax=Gelidibacter sediminis TaxID=1608710 RepID=A0A4R7Q0D6_9FLAO|nr:NAD-dependent succinate-semialdehyde dehydrogenase [Gelidibacter sediminis]TDU40059.1 succinate-semialdehyde dehydrogenase/glutarate-semialdehyde dehydrogenase [Gelidibacter sediminis]